MGGIAMRLLKLFAVVPLFASFAFSAIAKSEPILGIYESANGSGWAASWLALDQPQDFGREERLCLRLDGSADVVVRLLPKDREANQPVGIDGGIRTVADDGVLEVTLVTDHRDTIQISVHSGAGAWQWKFPQGNPDRILLSAERLSHSQSCI